MKKDEKTGSQKNQVQTGQEVKKDLPVKSPVTDNIKNTAAQTPGLNQANTTRDDLFPSDGDNMIN